MDWFEQLRREHEFGIGTISGVAAKFGVHRRVVRRAIAGALPPPHCYPERSKPKLGGLQALIERVLDEDRRAPRKQRHTARGTDRGIGHPGPLPHFARSSQARIAASASGLLGSAACSARISVARLRLAVVTIAGLRAPGGGGLRSSFAGGV
jgi:hypothetical protein